MNNPYIYIGEVKHTAPMPKAKAWALTMQLGDRIRAAKNEDLLNVYAEYIAALIPDVTAAEIIDNCTIDVIAQTYRDLESWVMALVLKKAEEIPKNVTSPAE